MSLGFRQASLLLICALDIAACKADRCASEPPAFELELTLDKGLSQPISRLDVEVNAAGKTRSTELDAARLVANGRGSVVVLVGEEGRGGFEAQVTAKAVTSGGVVIAQTEQRFNASGNSCNFFSMSLGAADAGPGQPDRSPDVYNPCPPGQGMCGSKCVSLTNDANCGRCGNVCAPTQPCTEKLCQVTISGGWLGGLQDHSGKRVVLSGAVRVIPYNLSDDLTQCDLSEHGCVRIKAAQIVIGAGATLDASGSGWGGGGGGGGAPGYAGGMPGSGSCRDPDTKPGAGGKGDLGGLEGQAGTMTADAVSGGAGGKGGGPFGGAGGGPVSAQGDDGIRSGKDGQPGGYAAPATNGDTTADETLRIGSAGGGGSGGASARAGWYFSVGGSGGGGAGNYGGGYIVLDASDSIVVAGTIKTEGLASQSGDGWGGTTGMYTHPTLGAVHCDLTGTGGPGGNAKATGTSSGGPGDMGFFQAGWDACVQRQCESNGSSSFAGGKGGNGAAGAGGGVLLKAPSLLLSGTVSALGGGASTENSGTVKLFYKATAPSQAGIKAGRVLLRTY